MRVEKHMQQQRGVRDGLKNAMVAAFYTSLLCETLGVFKPHSSRVMYMTSIELCREKGSVTWISNDCVFFAGSYTAWCIVNLLHFADQCVVHIHSAKGYSCSKSFCNLIHADYPQWPLQQYLLFQRKNLPLKTLLGMA